MPDLYYMLVCVTPLLWQVAGGLVPVVCVVLLDKQERVMNTLSVNGMNGWYVHASPHESMHR